MTEAEKAAAELAHKLAGIQNDVKAQGGQVTDLAAKIEAVQTAQLQVRQAVEATHRAERERSVQGGTERDLMFYTAKSDAMTSENRKSFQVAGDDAVQMVGDFRKAVSGNEVYRTWHPGLLDDPNPRTTEQLRLQRAVERRSIARSLLERKHTPLLDAEVRSAAAACGPVVAKIFADSAGIGAEWVPDTFLPELERDVQAPTGFAALFRQRMVSPGTIKIPSRSSGRLRAYVNGVPTTNNPADALISTWTTSNNSIDTKPLYVAAQVERDFDEDSIIAIMPEIREEMARAFGWAIDDAIINGDTNATHQDAIATWDGRGELGGTSGLGTTADHRRAWLGLRARAADLTSMTTDQTAAKTFAGLLVALAKLGPKNLMNSRMGQGGNRVVVAPSWEYFFSTMLSWSEFLTWDKAGPYASALTGSLGPNQAPLLPGQVGFLSGFLPVCIPAPLTADLASTGLYTGSGTTTGMLQFDASRFEFVTRMGMRFETATRIENNTVTAVARGRYLFRAQDAVASTIKDVHYSYNL
jgi:hypothetical protein